MYIYVCMHRCTHTHTQESTEAKDSTGSLKLEFEAVVSNLTWSWELNSGPLQEQQGLSTLNPCPLPSCFSIPLLFFLEIFKFHLETLVG